jgi:3D-(3,5/4)-trihydroxycyclohexane-1,2-dione acylhydrolase (decyclizing)
LPTYRAHSEQAMANAAIAYAKAHMRRRMMAATSSIGPGATNLVTSAALAHVNRLPVLLLPGDIFVSRAPDPVLQQVEDFSDGTVSVNDCLRPVSRYFDRIVRPEQLHRAASRAGCADRPGAAGRSRWRCRRTRRSPGLANSFTGAYHFADAAPLM